MSLSVRVLTPDDLDAYRALHRHGLKEAPYAFADTAALDAARTDADVAAMLARGEAWGVFEGERLIGKLVLDTPGYPCFAHTRWVHAVYLHPEARGKGAATAMTSAAIEHARSQGARLIGLWVQSKNPSARRMYEALGFVEAGRVPLGIEVGGVLVDDVMMCLALGEPAGRPV